MYWTLSKLIQGSWDFQKEQAKSERKNTLPDTGKINKLQDRVNNIYEQEYALMQKALPGILVEMPRNPGWQRISFLGASDSEQTKNQIQRIDGLGSGLSNLNNVGTDAMRWSTNAAAHANTSTVNNQEQDRIRSHPTKSIHLPHLQGLYIKSAHETQFTRE
jgi:hypothetical protein